MLTEYPGYKLSAVRFLDHNLPSQERLAITGSCEDSNVVEMWSCQNSFEVVDQQPFEGDVTDIALLPGNLIAIPSSNGSLFIYHKNDHQLEQVIKISASNLPLTSVSYHEQSKSIFSVGEDGNMFSFSLDALSSKPSSLVVSSTPLTSLDSLSENALICGNTAGHLKVVDLRNKRTAMSLPNGLCGLTVTRRNPSNPHVVVTGNQAGTLCVWDLRKSGSSLGDLVAHSSSITELLFREQGKLTITSSLDGQLLKWTFNSIGHLDNAEAIVRPLSLSGPAILCFDLHSSSDSVILANDKHVLSLINL